VKIIGLAIVVIVVAVAVLMWIFIAVKGSADEYLHSTTYEVERMLAEMEGIYAERYAELSKLMEDVMKRLDRYDRAAQRLVVAVWPDLSDKEKRILSLYLQGYNKEEISERLNVPAELVEAVIALRVGEEDA